MRGPKHILQINDSWLKHIEDVQSRLKQTIPPSRIKHWLENFASEDAKTALYFLMLFEYIPYEELQSRLDEQLGAAIDTALRKDANSQFLILPYGKPGKSGPFMTYPLRNTTVFKKYEERITISFDYNEVSTNEHTVLIMIDDFVGSGETFIEEYTGYEEDGNVGYGKIEYWADGAEIKRHYLIAAIIMEKGKEKISRVFNKKITVFSETRIAAFDSKKSPFNVFGNREELRALCIKYGFELEKGPFGFDNSESLVAFAHTTPDNTLPIIWDDSEWLPIFPRKPRTRMDQVKALKKEVAFYMGIMNYLKLDLYDDRSIVIDGKRSISYNSREDHSLVTYIKLKLEGLDFLVICQILGISKQELEEIKAYGRERQLLDSRGDVNPQGHEFYKSLMKTVGQHKFRKRETRNFKMNNEVYIPKTFKGMT